MKVRQNISQACLALWGLFSALSLASGHRTLTLTRCQDRLVQLNAFPRHQSNYLLPNAGPAAVRGSLLALAEGQNITIWRSSDQKHVETLKGHQSRVTQLAFHPQHNVLFSLSEDGESRLWWHSQNALLKNLVLPIGSPVSQVGFTQAGAILLGTQAGKVILGKLTGERTFSLPKILPLETLDDVILIELPLQESQDIAFRETRVWTQRPGEPMQFLASDISGDLIFTGSQKQVALHQVKGELFRELSSYETSEAIQLASISPNGEFVALILSSGTLVLLDAFRDRVLHESSLLSNILSVDVDETGKHVVVTDDRGLTTTYFLDDRELKPIFQIHHQALDLWLPPLGSRPGLL